MLIMASYRPYSPEWNRKRYLKEAIDKYLDDYIDNNLIIDDILDIARIESNEITIANVLMSVGSLSIHTLL